MSLKSKQRKSLAVTRTVAVDFDTPTNAHDCEMDEIEALVYDQDPTGGTISRYA